MSAIKHKHLCFLISLFIFIGSFSFSQKVFAAVLFETSIIGTDYFVNDPAEIPYGHYVRNYRGIAPLYSGSGGWTATGNVRFIRVKLAAINQVACSAITNVGFYQTNGDNVMS